MKQYSQWKDEEVIKLFRFIENGKKQNICLSTLFANYAKQTNRMPNSVRNYYYKELGCLMEDKSRQEKLGIDISLHQKIDQKEFTLTETETLVKQILSLTSKGVSVRKACLTLANGDISTMVRLQNKFRSVVIKEKELYEKCLSDLNCLGVKIKQKPNNIIKMPDRRNILTESDINSLFLGLVKLVKKQATEEVVKLYQKDKQKANEHLRRMLVELAEKENELKNLRRQFKVVSQEKEKLSEELKVLRGKNAQLQIKQEKLSALKKFTNKFEQKNSKTIHG